MAMASTLQTASVDALEIPNEQEVSAAVLALRAGGIVCGCCGGDFGEVGEVWFYFDV
jgi:hypothetical protein